MNAFLLLGEMISLGNRPSDATRHGGITTVSGERVPAGEYAQAFTHNKVRLLSVSMRIDFSFGMNEEREHAASLLQASMLATFDLNGGSARGPAVFVDVGSQWSASRLAFTTEDE